MRRTVRLCVVAGVATSALPGLASVMAVPADAAEIRCRDLCVVEAKGRCYKTGPVCYFDDGFSAGVYPWRPVIVAPPPSYSTSPAPIIAPYRPPLRSVPRR